MGKASVKHNNQQHARVVLFPPLVGLTLAVIPISLHVMVPLFITSATTVVILAGSFILIGGIALQVICIRVMKKAKTTPLFQKPTTNLLQVGPYGRSRNPIYIAVFLQFLGLTFLFNTWWLVMALPILYFYLRYGVIAREEQYLSQKFGEEYHRYRSEVPRWF